MKQLVASLVYSYCALQCVNVSGCCCKQRREKIGQRFPFRQSHFFAASSQVIQLPTGMQHGLQPASVPNQIWHTNLGSLR
eukprot:5313212-Amphidinium_carterae.1